MKICLVFTVLFIILKLSVVSVYNVLHVTKHSSTLTIPCLGTKKIVSAELEKTGDEELHKPDLPVELVLTSSMRLGFSSLSIVLLLNVRQPNRTIIKFYQCTAVC